MAARADRLGNSHWSRAVRRGIRPKSSRPWGQAGAMDHAGDDGHIPAPARERTERRSGAVVLVVQM
ncbi:hypothetical protein ACIPSA_42970 [Streptomyces sp. NPDC086549]|uniref:hypothetical protein n=1 Tax=Streptomyces sp. NPDC086549 TaxID=3365752 RepID=UPI0038047DD4